MNDRLMQPSETGGSRAQPPRAHRALVVAVILALVALMSIVPVIMRTGALGRPGEDQINYHEPAIRTFAAALPKPDLSNYKSATTPGYHLTVAAVARWVSDDTRSLRVAGAMFAVALSGVVGWTVARGSAGLTFAEAVVAALPVVASQYVTQSGVWLLPDNAGWLCVAVVLAMALVGRPGTRWLIGASLAMVGLVMMRQIHLWAAGLVWAAAWLGDDPLKSGSVAEIATITKARLRRVVFAMAATAPAFIVLAMFARMWHGLTPPMFQGQYRGFNAAAPAFILTLVGIASVFFVGYLWPTIRGLPHSGRVATGLALVAGGLVAVIPPTTYSVELGRFSGIWNVAAKGPVIAGHTTALMVAGSMFGAVMMLAWARALAPRDRWICLAAFAGFAFAQAASIQLWQRYSEPFVLMMCAIMAARVAAPEKRNLCRVLGPAGLAAGLAVVSVMSIVRSQPAVMYEFKVPGVPETPSTLTPGGGQPR